MKTPSRLQTALTRGLAPDGDLFDELNELGAYEIASVADAEALTMGMAEFAQQPVSGEDAISAFAELTHLFKHVTSAEAFRYLALKGIPHLIEAYDARMIDPGEYESELVQALWVFARYGTEEGLDRVVEAAFNSAMNDDSLWSSIFDQLGDSDPLIPSLIRRLSNPLPERQACIGFLNWVNRLARDRVIAHHPFNSDQGTERFRAWLTNSDDEWVHFAHSAAAALPFITDPPRSELLALAMDHPEIGVQMEAAWASAHLGSEAGLKFLSRLCLDRNRAITARKYLCELDREDVIPEQANDPDFLAMAEMCNWLSDPHEFGRPPDDIEIFDTREMIWPPTNDWRQLWLFKYCYRAGPEDVADQVGIGMTGSITFALFEELDVNMRPEDIYALHCCWELEVNEDPRAPTESSIEAGRNIIDAAQQDDIEDDEKF